MEITRSIGGFTRAFKGIDLKFSYEKMEYFNAEKNIGFFVFEEAPAFKILLFNSI